MKMTRVRQDRQTRPLRLSADLLSQVEALAKQHQRSFNSEVVWALEQYVKRQERTKAKAGPMTLLEVLEGLNPHAVIRNIEFGDEHTVATVLTQLSGDSAMAEPATLQGNEIYLTTESGDIYTAADPVFVIVKK
jgi:hypothetical protein